MQILSLLAYWQGEMGSLGDWEEDGFSLGD
jgi:hypothetical protein